MDDASRPMADTEFGTDDQCEPAISKFRSLIRLELGEEQASRNQLLTIFAHERARYSCRLPRPGLVVGGRLVTPDFMRSLRDQIEDWQERACSSAEAASATTQPDMPLAQFS